MIDWALDYLESPDGWKAIAVVGGIVVVAMIAANVRRQSPLERWALANGFASSGPPRDSASGTPVFDRFARLRGGSGSLAHNIWWRNRNGRQLYLFDYRPDSENWSNWKLDQFSCVLIETGLRDQRLSIKPEGVRHRVAQELGFDDVDFESAAFSNRFRVRSPSRRWAYDIIDQKMMELLISHPPFTLELEGPWMLITGRGRFRPKRFAAAVNVAEGFVKSIQPSVLREAEESHTRIRRV